MSGPCGGAYEGPQKTVDSTGQRNTFAEHFSGRVERGKSLLSRLRTAQLWTGVAPAVECRQSSIERYGQRCAADQTDGQSGGASSQPSSAPTSVLSGCRCSRFAAVDSSATLLPPRRIIVCCIDRLNPPFNRRDQSRHRVRCDPPCAGSKVDSG